MNVKQKPLVLLHRVTPDKLGGPNVVLERIFSSSKLNKDFDFVYIDQPYTPGGGLNFHLIRYLRGLIKFHVNECKDRTVILHIMGMQNSGFHAVIASLGLNCKRVVTTHGFTKQLIDFEGFTLKKAFLHYLFEPLTLFLSHRVHCISSFSYNQAIVRIFAKNKSTIIYNPTVSNGSAAVKNKSPSVNNVVKILSAGRIEKSKGYDVLIDVIAEMFDFPVHFIIAGDGSYAGEFCEQVNLRGFSSKVKFLGRVDDLSSLYSESDIFILLSKHENLGNVFLEAMQAGLPLVGSNVGGIPDMITDEFNGYLVDPINISMICERLKILILDDELRRNMASNSLRNYESKFSSESIFNKFYNLYKF